MTTKLHRYFWIVLPTFLVITLAACAPVVTPVPTEPPIPTAASPILLPTSTLIPATDIPTQLPTPLPTQPIIPIITPDPIEVERWKEYESALAKTFFHSLPSENVVCEWEILGRADQEVYVYAHCAGIYSADPSQGSIPAVIHIATDGSVTRAEIPGSGTAYGADIRRMFPQDAQERIFIQPIDYLGSDAYWRAIEQADRLRWRRGHPEEPPWIVLNSLSIQPTQPVIPLITPDPTQVERWSGYQTALARSFLSYLPPEEVICEWEILGQSDQEVYVWAICAEAHGAGSLEGLAVIYVGNDGVAIYAATAGIGGMGFPSEIQRIFPLNVQERYFGGLIHFQELVDHLRWRQMHHEEPPLIAFSETPVP